MGGFSVSAYYIYYLSPPLASMFSWHSGRAALGEPCKHGSEDRIPLLPTANGHKKKPWGECLYRSVRLGRIISIFYPFPVPHGSWVGGHGKKPEREPEFRGSFRGNGAFCRHFRPSCRYYISDDWCYGIATDTEWAVHSRLRNGYWERY